MPSERQPDDKVSVVEAIAEDDQLSNILSQDSKVFEVDKTIDEIEIKKPEVDTKSDTNSKTQLAHQNSKTSRQISDITEQTHLNIAQTPKIQQTADIKVDPSIFQKLQTKRDQIPKLNFDYSRISPVEPSN